MALVLLGESTCPLCDEVLEQGQDIVATSAFIEDSEHPLWPFQDAGIHRTCFLEWPERERFVTLFNDYHARNYRGMLFMHSDGSLEEREPRAEDRRSGL